jgi:hypothetical protein
VAQELADSRAFAPAKTLFYVSTSIHPRTGGRETVLYAAAAKIPITIAVTHETIFILIKRAACEHLCA